VAIQGREAHRLVGQFATKAVLPPDTGSLRGDIQAIAHDAIAMLANPSFAVRSSRCSPRRAVRRTSQRYSPSASSIHDGRPTHGCSGTPLTVVRFGPTAISNSPTTLIGGPLHRRGVILGEEIPPGYSERLTDAVLRALGAK
jgi:hypothetical protein